MNVIKRDGTIVPFDKNKIINAINKAFIDVDGQLYETDTAQDIADDIEYILEYGNKNITLPLTVEKFEKADQIEVEHIQDLVEDYLMRSERRDVARAYIRYRYKREVAREKRDDFIEAIGEKLSASNVQNQNANVDEESFGGRAGEAQSLLTKTYALNYLVSDIARKNHLENYIYIHDLDAYAVGSHNCLSIPFDHLLANGFNTRQTDLRPAGSVYTAFQLIAVIFQLQSLQQFGGVSATHLDWTMVPYVRKSFYKHWKNAIKYIARFGCDMPEKEFVGYNDTMPINDKKYKKYDDLYRYAMDMTEKEVHQAVEGMYHNLNTLQSRSGN